MKQDRNALEAAEAALRKGETEEAERVLAARPDSLECTSRLRDLLVTQGRTDEALALAQRHRDTVGRALEAHLGGDFRRAAKLCDEALSARRDDPAALLHRARAVHNLGQMREAVESLRKLTRTAPDFAEGWYALAHALRAGGDLPGAIDAYEQALDRSPGLTVARFNLGLTCLNADRPEQALASFEKLLEGDSNNLDALVHAGLAQQMLGRVKAARRLFERALSLNPGHAEAHRYLGALLNEAGDGEAAREHLEQALESNPGDPELLADLADVYELSNELDEVEAVLERGLSSDSGHPRLLITRARLLRRRGECRQAVDSLQRLDPRQLPPRLAMQFFHEFGLSLDRLEEADSAMQAFETANRIAAGDPRAQSVDGAAFFERVKAIEAWLAGRGASAAPNISAAGDAGYDLCFLIGFPRSGTTLIDTIIDAHEGVTAIEEKPTLEPLIEWLAESPAGYPQALDELDEADLEAMRRAYRDEVAKWITETRPGLVVDKLPLRLIDVGFIRRLFPAARLLLVERHPCDVVLSNFMQLYEPTPAFVNCYTLDGAVRFYDAVMSLWPRLEPLAGDALHKVRYEDLVANPERELSAVCRHLGIEWDAANLDPERRLQDRGRVRTTSYQQVGEAVYNRASGRWRRYRRQLAPFFDTLHPHAQRMGYELDQD